MEAITQAMEEEDLLGLHITEVNFRLRELQPSYTWDFKGEEPPLDPIKQT